MISNSSLWWQHISITSLLFGIFFHNLTMLFHDWSHHRQILLVSEIVVLVGILLSFNIIIPYSVPQYVCSGLIMFVSAEVLEGQFLHSHSNRLPFYLISGRENLSVKWNKRGLQQHLFKLLPLAEQSQLKTMRNTKQLKSLSPYSS